MIWQTGRLGARPLWIGVNEGDVLRNHSAHRIARRTGTVLAATGLALSLTGPAWAGTLNSYLHEVMVGFESSSWEHTGRASTVIHFTGCSLPGATFKDTTVELTRARPVLPDISQGQKTFSACKNGGTSKGDWGARERNSRYYFTIKKINGGGGNLRMNVKTVKVTY
ncbi:hypothetical protein [Streptomyces corynorhini]|uniref:Uncharacterized protein n=1 Tax=Streptomyces corynorhini TaxID=2282652 RepID=A0A370B6M9_9ACTN|nr:hypothetical protein [Streptomyces corynorhini]RDG36039.1 hypothetical protein DVH02_22140 [Streptomyces corynorhini]